MRRDFEAGDTRTPLKGLLDRVLDSDEVEDTGWRCPRCGDTHPFEPLETQRD